MLDANNVVMSAAKNGHTDIYTYKIEENQLTQFTDDVYDDLHPSFVSFPNKSGILFASNRPSPYAPNADTAIPSKYHFNVFMVDYLNNSKNKQITQLTNLKYGNASYPMGYNTNHFTFVADENGVGNRWAGFFATQRNGLDTLYHIGDDMLRNASPKEIDSTLNAWQREKPDSISYFQVYKDSTYTFPITNYQSSLLETRISGDKGQVSEVRREGDYKFLYKLRVDSIALKKRNLNVRPTTYMKKVMDEMRAQEGKAIVYKKNRDTVAKANLFQSEFSDEPVDSFSVKKAELLSAKAKDILSDTRLFDYRLKFSSDYILSGFSNNLLLNRYQPYAGGQGPINLSSNSVLNGLIRLGTSELMEDIKITGAFKLSTNLKFSPALIVPEFRNILPLSIYVFVSNLMS
jgi:hypothetical protein